MPTPASGGVARGRRGVGDGGAVGGGGRRGRGASSVTGNGAMAGTVWRVRTSWAKSFRNRAVAARHRPGGTEAILRSEGVAVVVIRRGRGPRRAQNPSATRRS